MPSRSPQKEWSRGVSYYDEHRDEADRAGVTSAQIEDFARRNPGHDGRGSDYGRAIEALTNYTGDRPFDSQSAMYDQRTNQLSPMGLAALQQRGLVAPARDLPAQGWQMYTGVTGSPYRQLRPPPLTLGDMTGLWQAPRY